MLYSRRCLRNHKNYIQSTQGFNQNVVHELFKNVDNFSQEEKDITPL